MKIIVTPHTITLNKTEIVNEGEYNINTCEFELSEEYQGLSCVAVFTNGTDTYSQIISNNQCIIPSEVLQSEGTMMVGVYGYEVDGDNLIKRYSPTPVTFYIEKGSYTMADEPTPPSPSIVEQLQAQITENANNITTLDGLVSANTQAIETINQELPSFAKKTEIPTKTSQLTNDSGYITDGDIPSKTSQLENDSGFITKSVNDLENYTKTSDLSSVATSGNYSDLSGTPDLSVYSLITETGSKIDLEINSSTYVLTAKLYDKNNTLISTSTGIDLPLETMVVGARYDDTTKSIILTLKNGQEVSFSVADLVSGLQPEITSSNKLSSDLVDDTNSNNKFVSASDITTWNNKQNALTFDTTPTNGSTNPVTSGGIYTYVNNIVGDINTALDLLNGEVI
jgi:hypothetical protein